MTASPPPSTTMAEWEFYTWHSFYFSRWPRPSTTVYDRWYDFGAFL